MKKTLILLCMVFTISSYSQTKPDTSSLKGKALNVFLDCANCDMDYLRTEIPVINYVRDRKESDVDIVVSTITTGSGGTEYTFVFIGRNKYKSQTDTLKMAITSFETDEGTRRKVARTLTMGLTPYIARTPFADKLNISFHKDTSAKSLTDVNVNPALDKWKSWVFTTSISSNINEQALINQVSANPMFTITKITPEWKLTLAYSLNYQYYSYNLGDSTLKTVIRTDAFAGYFVKSLSEHFSAAIVSGENASTASNYKLQSKLGPGVEYSIFPYSECTHRQLRFIYAIYGVDNNYIDTTIYGKINQKLGAEALTVYSQYKEKWGSLTMQATGSHYFYDPSKYELNMNLNLTVNLFEGFSITGFFYANIIHDQLFLPAAGPSETDILLGLQILATTYQYGTGIQFSYTFGSIYNNIVNPRFNLLFPYN